MKHIKLTFIKPLSIQSIGIMVEFCGHIIFHNAKSTISCPIQRASNTCADIGSSVILNKNCVIKYNYKTTKCIQSFKNFTKKFK